MQYSNIAARHRQATFRRVGFGRQCVLQLAVFAFTSLGFAQISQAGMISSADARQIEQHATRTASLEAFLSRSDVAAELTRYGVSPDVVMARVNSLSDAEIAALQGRLDEQVAGGDALAVIGVVFLVLLILEVVGVTDIFKSV